MRCRRGIGWYCRRRRGLEQLAPRAVLQRSRRKDANVAARRRLRGCALVVCWCVLVLHSAQVSLSAQPAWGITLHNLRPIFLPLLLLLLLPLYSFLYHLLLPTTPSPLSPDERQGPTVASGAMTPLLSSRPPNPYSHLRRPSSSSVAAPPASYLTPVYFTRSAASSLSPFLTHHGRLLEYHAEGFSRTSPSDQSAR